MISRFRESLRTLVLVPRLINYCSDLCERLCNQTTRHLDIYVLRLPKRQYKNLHGRGRANQTNNNLLTIQGEHIYIFIYEIKLRHRLGWSIILSGVAHFVSSEIASGQAKLLISCRTKQGFIWAWSEQIRNFLVSVAKFSKCQGCHIWYVECIRLIAQGLATGQSPDSFFFAIWNTKWNNKSEGLIGQHLANCYVQRESRRSGVSLEILLEHVLAHPKAN